jgi:hypothetical protein
MGDGGIVSVGGCEGSGGRLGCMGCMAMEELGIQRVGWRAEETKRGLFWGTLTGMLRGDEQWGRGHGPFAIYISCSSPFASDFVTVPITVCFNRR